MRYSLITGFALTVFALSSFAQQGGCYLAVKNTQLLLKTKTIVLLSGDKAYNEAITKAFKEHWKVTPYAFAPYSDLPKYISSYEHSLVLPVQDANTLVIAVLRGDKRRKSVADYNSESMIAYADIDNLGLEPTMTDAIYRLPHMIKSMDAYIHAVGEGDINVSSCDKIRLNTAKFYNKRAEEIKQKTLLIDNRYILKVDIDDVYPYSYKIADKSEIAGAITTKKAGFCYLAGNYIFDAQTGEVLHMSFDSPPDKKLTKAFFKELLSNINK